MVGMPDKCDRHPNRIRSAREALKLRQEDLARACRVRQSAVSRWEAGVRLPRPAMRARLATALRTTPDDLFEEAS